MDERKKPRILVVDDELGIRQGCRRILSSEGYDVETAEDGLAGWELFQQHRNFSAALIDLKMPRMDGIELIQKIHEQDGDIILFVVTAYASIEKAVEFIQKGAYGYIPKPFTPDELLVPLRHGLERRSLLREIQKLRQERENQLLDLAFECSKSSTIIKCMADGVLVLNCEGQLVLQNAAAARILMGHISHPFSSFLLQTLGCPDMDTLLRTVLNADSKAEVLSRDLVLGPSTYMINVSPIIDDVSSEVSGVVAVLRDITALKPD